MNTCYEQCEREPQAAKGIQPHKMSERIRTATTTTIVRRYRNQQSISATVASAVWISKAASNKITAPSTDTEELREMKIEIGGFVLEVGVWILYVRAPALGELCWTPQFGLTANR